MFAYLFFTQIKVVYDVRSGPNAKYTLKHINGAAYQAFYNELNAALDAEIEAARTAGVDLEADISRMVSNGART